MRCSAPPRPGAQTAGKVALDVDALGVDLLTLAAHKFYAPKGVGSACHSEDDAVSGVQAAMGVGATRAAGAVRLSVGRTDPRRGHSSRRRCSDCFLAASFGRVSPQEYDGWYRTPRGAWIGDSEFRLLINLLRPRTRESLLDVGCGTGYFTRRLAREAGLHTTGINLERKPACKIDRTACAFALAIGRLSRGRRRQGNLTKRGAAG